ncbi:hypothetical protein Tco_0404405 [Tanacetum coccineum]
MTMDQYTKNALWIYWTGGDDEVKLTDEESSDPSDEYLIDENEVAKIFRIETNIFDFETPTCKAFKEFNYLFQIDPDFSAKVIIGFKTYIEYKEDYIYEWMKDVPCWKDDGYCNGGNLPGAYRIGNTLCYQDLKYLEKYTIHNHEKIDYEETDEEVRKPNDDHDISNLDYDLVRDNASYHTIYEEELQKE